MKHLRYFKFYFGFFNNLFEVNELKIPAHKKITKKVIGQIYKISKPPTKPNLNLAFQRLNFI